MAKTQRKLYIVRKYIWAKSAEEAIKKDAKKKVDDVWGDDDWKKNTNQTADAMGFLIDSGDDY